MRRLVRPLSPLSLVIALTLLLAACLPPTSVVVTLTLSEPSLTLAPGESGSVTVTVEEPAGSGRTAVRLDVEGLPAGVDVDYSVNPARTESVLTLTASDAVEAGAYAVTISGAGNSAVIEQAELTLFVGPSQRDEDEVVIPDTTKILGAATRDSLVAFDDDGSLRFSDPSLAERFEVGDVIVSEPAAAAPSGLLRRVLAIHQEGDSLLLETEQAVLTDAIHQGEAESHQEVGSFQLTPSGVMSTNLDLVDTAGLTIPLPPIDVLISDADGNPATTDDQVRVQGSAAFDIGHYIALGFRTDVSLDFSPVEIQTMFKSVFYVNQTSELTLVAGASASFDETIDLGTFPLPPIYLQIGIFPVWIEPSLNVRVFADGQVGTTVSFGASEQLNLTVGLEKPYGGSFRPIANVDPAIHPHATVLETSYTNVAFDARAGLELRGSMKFYGLAGPFLEVRPQLRLEGQIPGDPAWELYGDLEGRVGLYVDILSKFDYHWSRSVFNESTLIDRASGDHAPEIQSFSATPYNAALGYQVAQPVAFNTLSFDIEDGQILGGSYRSDIDGPLTLDGQNRVFFTTPGVRTVTVTVTDSDGNSAQASRVLDVRNTPPTVTIGQPSHLSTAYRGVPILLVGSATDPNEPDGVVPCYGMVWTSSDPGDVLPTSTCGGPVQITFATTGARTLTLAAYDKHGASHSALTTVVVVEPPAGNLPPQATIIEPANGGTFDDLDGLRATGRAFDPDNSGLAYAWRIAWNGGSTVIESGVVTGTDQGHGVPLEVSWDPVPCRSAMTLTLELYDGEHTVQSPLRSLTCLQIPR